MSFAFLGMGGTEMLVVMGAALVLFGSKKIPEFAKGLGSAMREFKKASADVSYELQNAMNSEPVHTPPPPPPAKLAAPALETTATVSSAPAATVPKST